MHISKKTDLQRRAFMQRALALGAYGMAGPLVSALSGFGTAAAAGTSAGYKALVCVFLYGGNDHGNTVIPYDQPSYDAYSTIRQNMAIPRDQLAATVLKPSLALPDGRSMALAPSLARLMPSFDAGRLAVMLNVGNLIEPTTVAQYQARSVPLPAKLFSHDDQTKLWQESAARDVNTGWGGRMADLLLTQNTSPVFTNINVSGNAVFMAGKKVNPYQISASGPIAIDGLDGQIFGEKSVPSALRALITSPRSQWFEQNLNQITQRSINAQSASVAALAAVPDLATPFDSKNYLASQLKTVARMVAARTALGAGRQVFFVSMGGFDTHDQLATRQPALLATLGDALASFYEATIELGVSDQVTAFTASDFGRTLSVNGDGSDHGWGSHHFVLGGAVNGGRFWGQAPEISVGGANDVGQGRLLPTTAVDQLAATLATWMGISSTDLATVLPQIVNYSTRNLGFMSA